MRGDGPLQSGTCLEAVHALGGVGGGVVEALDVGKAEVEGHAQMARQGEQEAATVIEAAGEFFVKPYPLGADAELGVEPPPQQAHATAALGSVAAGKDELHLGEAVDIDQAYLAVGGAFAVVDQTYLPAFLAVAHIGHANLPATKVAGIVEDGGLETSHFTLRHIDQAGQLQTAVYTDGDVGHTGELRATQGFAHDIVDRGELEAVVDDGDIGECGELQAVVTAGGVDEQADLCSAAVPAAMVHQCGELEAALPPAGHIEEAGELQASGIGLDHVGQQFDADTALAVEVGQEAEMEGGGHAVCRPGRECEGQVEPMGQRFARLGGPKLGKGDEDGKCQQEVSTHGVFGLLGLMGKS